MDAPSDYNGPREQAGIVSYLEKVSGPASAELKTAKEVRALEPCCVAVTALNVCASDCLRLGRIHFRQPPGSDLVLVAHIMAVLADGRFVHANALVLTEQPAIGRLSPACWEPLSGPAGAQVEAFRKKDLALLGAFAPGSAELAAFLAAAEAMREDFDCAHVLDASLLAEVISR